MLASGCAHYSPRTNILSAQTVASLNAIANDIGADPDERCSAIFSLFRHFIKPGSTPHEIQAVLTDTRWLEQTNVHGVYLLAGWIPVQWEFGRDTPFVVFVLPASKPSSGRPPTLGYHVYFALAGGASRSEESAFGILTGQQTWDRKAILKEFALCYPDGTIERVTKSGTRKFNMWSNQGAAANRPQALRSTPMDSLNINIAAHAPGPAVAELRR
jgi:hypothetical protein